MEYLQWMKEYMEHQENAEKCVCLQYVMMQRKMMWWIQQNETKEK